MREIPEGPAELRRGYYNDDRASSPTGGSEAESYSEAAVGRLNLNVQQLLLNGGRGDGGMERKMEIFEVAIR